MQFYFLAHADQLVDGYRKTFNIQGQSLLLFQHQGEIHLFENICPHAAYPMTDAKIIGSDLRCPMHGYLFDLNSGECTYYTEGPCRALRRFSLVEEGDKIGVML